MLNTNCEYLKQEIMDVLRAYDMQDEDFTHYFSYSAGKFFNSIEYKSVFYDYTEEYNPQDDLHYKRYAKRFCKLAFYKTLQQVTGKSLPWGALTGIRPCKLAYMEEAEDKNFKNTFASFGVSEQNIKTVEKILEVQKPYISGGKSLYISVPFCPTKCSYCSFITAPISTTGKFIDEYITCLLRELSCVKPDDKIRSVYVGGGTPFVLDIPQLTRIYTAIKALLPNIKEYTVEAGRPDVFSEDKLKLSKDFGVTRICVNPQSFNDKTLVAIGRKHTAEQTIKAVELTKKYGFDINLDLIAGLADEGVEDFAYSLNKAIELNPENITVHVLSLKSGAKLKESVKRLNVSGIGEMIELSRERLFAAGYLPYYLYRQKYQAGGLENVGWCKPGKACVYNIDVMEELGDNLAVGANAISKRIFSGGRIERCDAPKDVQTYITEIDRVIKKRKEFFDQP